MTEIIENEEIRFGKPIIKGTRICVHDVYQWASQGLKVSDICNRWNLTEEQVITALDYADDNKDEIKSIIREQNQKFIERKEGSQISSGVNLLSIYTPDTYRKPLMLISTVYGTNSFLDKGNSTAILFGEALNREHLLSKIFMTHKQREVTVLDNETLEVSDFKEIKPHNTRKSAIDFHSKFVENLNREKYQELYEEYCPEELKSDLANGN